MASLQHAIIGSDSERTDFLSRFPGGAKESIEILIHDASIVLHRLLNHEAKLEFTETMMNGSRIDRSKLEFTDSIILRTLRNITQEVIYYLYEAFREDMQQGDTGLSPQKPWAIGIKDGEQS